MTDREYIEHMRRIQSMGGKANSPRQRLARTLNLYRGLAKKFPTSTTIREKVKELEREQEKMNRD